MYLNRVLHTGQNQNALFTKTNSINKKLTKMSLKNYTGAIYLHCLPKNNNNLFLVPGLRFLSNRPRSRSFLNLY